MMVVLILFGGSLVHGLLSPLGSAERAAAMALILIERPFAGLIGMNGFRAAAQEKFMLTVFPSEWRIVLLCGLWVTMARLAEVTGCEPIGMVGPLSSCRPTIHEYRVLTKAALRSIACERQQSPEAV